MNDPYEEERRARFVVPIDMLLDVVEGARIALFAAKKTPIAEESSQLFDRAMNALFQLFNLSMPVAHVRSKNGRLAFLWIDCTDKQRPAYRWAVCLADGRWKQGAEGNQKDCEQAAERLLGSPPGRPE